MKQTINNQPGDSLVDVKLAAQAFVDSFGDGEKEYLAFLNLKAAMQLKCDSLKSEKPYVGTVWHLKQYKRITGYKDSGRYSRKFVVNVEKDLGKCAMIIDESTSYVCAMSKTLGHPVWFKRFYLAKPATSESVAPLTKVAQPEPV